MNADELAELRDRHAAFVIARLTDARAEAAWRENVAAAIDALLGATVGDVLPVALVVDAVERVATHHAFDAFVAPIARASVAAHVVALAREPGKAGEHVPDAARDAIARLVARPGLAPARLVREICAQDAANEIMREVLSEALAEFQAKLNPFGFFKKHAPFGLGRSLDAFKAEFDKTLEPEMRRFLQGFSRRALGHFADVLIERWDEPSSIALRRSIAVWVYAQPLADAPRAVSGEAVEDATAASVAVARAWLTAPGGAARRRALAETALSPIAGLTLREALALGGAPKDLDPSVAAALAELTWPAARAVFSAPAVRAWFTSLVAEFYDSEIARLGASPGGE
ncbi:MAG TPA: hypothetical protein VGM56_11250 [Byssovorax sp.]